MDPDGYREERLATRDAMMEAESGFESDDRSYTIPATAWGVRAR